MSSETAVLKYKDLVDELRRLTIEKKTGTVLIATQDNQLARILIDNGEIIGLAYGLKHGLEAVPAISSISEGRVKFSESKVGSHEAGQLPPTHELLQLLAPGKAAAPTRAKEQQRASLRPDQVPAALKIVENELVEFLGPMASIVWQEYLDKEGKPSRVDQLLHLVNALTKEIGDPAKVAQFKEQVTKKMGSL